MANTDDASEFSLALASGGAVNGELLSRLSIVGEFNTLFEAEVYTTFDLKGYGRDAFAIVPNDVDNPNKGITVECKGTVWPGGSTNTALQAANMYLPIDTVDGAKCRTSGLDLTQYANYGACVCTMATMTQELIQAATTNLSGTTTSTTVVNQLPDTSKNQASLSQLALSSGGDASTNPVSRKLKLSSVGLQRLLPYTAGGQVTTTYTDVFAFASTQPNALGTTTVFSTDPTVASQCGINRPVDVTCLVYGVSVLRTVWGQIQRTAANDTVVTATVDSQLQEEGVGEGSVVTTRFFPPNDNCYLLCVQIVNTQNPPTTNKPVTGTLSIPRNFPTLNDRYVGVFINNLEGTVQFQVTRKYNVVYNALQQIVGQQKPLQPKSHWRDTILAGLLVTLGPTLSMCGTEEQFDAIFHRAAREDGIETLAQLKASGFSDFLKKVGGGLKSVGKFVAPIVAKKGIELLSNLTATGVVSTPRAALSAAGVVAMPMAASGEDRREVVLRRRTAASTAWRSWPGFHLGHEKQRSKLLSDRHSLVVDAAYRAGYELDSLFIEGLLPQDAWTRMLRNIDFQLLALLKQEPQPEVEARKPEASQPIKLTASGRTRPAADLPHTRYPRQEYMQRRIQELEDYAHLSEPAWRYYREPVVRRGMPASLENEFTEAEREADDNFRLYTSGGITADTLRRRNGEIADSLLARYEAVMGKPMKPRLGETQSSDWRRLPGFTLFKVLDSEHKRGKSPLSGQVHSMADDIVGKAQSLERHYQHGTVGVNEFKVKIQELSNDLLKLLAHYNAAGELRVSGRKTTVALAASGRPSTHTPAQGLCPTCLGTHSVYEDGEFLLDEPCLACCAALAELNDTEPAAVTPPRRPRRERYGYSVPLRSSGRPRSIKLGSEVPERPSAEPLPDVEAFVPAWPKGHDHPTGCKMHSGFGNNEYTASGRPKSIARSEKKRSKRVKITDEDIERAGSDAIVNPRDVDMATVDEEDEDPEDEAVVRAQNQKALGSGTPKIEMPEHASVQSTLATLSNYISNGDLPSTYATGTAQLVDGGFVSRIASLRAGSNKPGIANAAMFPAVLREGAGKVVAFLVTLVVSASPVAGKEYTSVRSGTLTLRMDKSFPPDDRDFKKLGSQVIPFLNEFGVRGNYYVTSDAPSGATITGPSYQLALCAAVLGVPNLAVYTGEVSDTGAIEPIADIEYKAGALAPLMVNQAVCGPFIIPNGDVPAIIARLPRDEQQVLNACASGDYSNMTSSYIATFPNVQTMLKILAVDLITYFNKFVSKKQNLSLYLVSSANYSKLRMAVRLRSSLLQAQSGKVDPEMVPELKQAAKEAVDFIRSDELSRAEQQDKLTVAATTYKQAKKAISDAYANGLVYMKDGELVKNISDVYALIGKKKRFTGPKLQMAIPETSEDGVVSTRLVTTAMPAAADFTERPKQGATKKDVLDMAALDKLGFKMSDFFKSDKKKKPQETPLEEMDEDEDL